MQETAAAEHPPGIDTKRLPELDGIRGCAILLVILWHYGGCQLPALYYAPPGTLEAYLWPIVRLTRSGVDLFFVLSGFLIGGILLDNRGKLGYFKTFYLRRFFRICPLYFLWLLLFFTLAALPIAQRETWLFEQPFPWWSYAAFLQNFWMAAEERYGPNFLGITWSLALEEQFYLVLPLVIHVLAPRVLPYFLALFIAAAPLFRFYLSQVAGADSHSLYVLLPCHADALLLGVLGAYFLRSRPEAAYSERCRTALRVGVLVSAALLAAVVVAGFQLQTYGIMAVIGHSVLAALYFCGLMLAVTHRTGRLAALLRVPLLQTCGHLAYGLYLFHQGISGLLHGLIRNQIPQIRTFPDAAVTGMALALTFALAYVSWHWFEKPLVARGHAFRYGS